MSRGRGPAYREIACRTALNRVKGMPFTWTLNPYRGCTHGCHFCFARRYQPQLEMDPGNEFSSVILVKVNFADVLRRELAGKPRPGERAAFGTATDPYQPIEGSYRLTRRALEALIERPMRIDLVTRGPLVVRDTDLLVELSRKVACTVSFSVPTTDEAAWRRLEPGTAHPLQRLRAMRALVAAGIEAGVLMAPVVPGISSARTKLQATVRSIADHGAKLEALTGEVDALGRDTRELKAELLTELPPAVVAAVDRTLGERVRDLERDVAELKR